MIESSGLTWSVILAFANLLLSSAIVITAFSLLGFMLTRNLRSAVAQTFSILLTCVLIVFAIDIIVPRVESADAATVWMRLQWIGIAMVPAGYLHFSDAVLRTTWHWSLRRRAVVIASYLFSGALVLMALFTDLFVREGHAHGAGDAPRARALCFRFSWRTSLRPQCMADGTFIARGGAA